jgi:predicted dithiol-disulfide oxidoreductase (DUF899 family)
MGYVGEDGGCLPGVSVLQRRETGIVRVSNAGFRAFDDFCTLWHLFDLLPEGPDGWRPRNVA